LAAKGLPLAERILDVSTWTMVALTVLLSHRWGAIISIALALVLLTADLSQMVWLPVAPSVLGRAGSILGLCALTWVVLHAVFAPGRITYQRVQGAIVVYLNVALIFASVYRLIWELSPAAFNHALSSGGGPGEIGTLLYFSLTTLTTTGYGDITPVDPVARSVANLEAVIGQFHLAITIARLVALEIAIGAADLTHCFPRKFPPRAGRQRNRSRSAGSALIRRLRRQANPEMNGCR
jgi:hypothetical protein